MRDNCISGNCRLLPEGVSQGLQLLRTTWLERDPCPMARPAHATVGWLPRSATKDAPVPARIEQIPCVTTPGSPSMALPRPPMAPNLYNSCPELSSTSAPGETYLLVARCERNRGPESEHGFPSPDPAGGTSSCNEPSGVHISGERLAGHTRGLQGLPSQDSAKCYGCHAWPCCNAGFMQRIAHTGDKARTGSRNLFQPRRLDGR